METDPLVRRRSSAAPVKVKPCEVGNPRSLSHRLIIIALMCFLSFGSYFCYDNPAALHDEIVNDLDVSESTFMSLYAWYSWPNVVLCFFGGFLLDRVFGVRLGSLIFSMLVVIGQLIFATGALVHKIWLMDLGRFIFGIGGESLAVAQNTYAVLWFKGKELNLVFGLQLSMARIGSTVNMNLMVPIYDMVNEKMKDHNKTLGVSLFIAALTCLFSLTCAISLAYLDKRAEKILNRKKNEAEEAVKLTDVKDFSIQLWLVFAICVAYYVAVFPFIGLGKTFFQEKFGFSSSSASAVNSIVYIMSAPCSPVLGFIIDRVGRNLFWILFAVVLTLASHGLLAFTFINPWFAMTLMGFAYSVLACALWPLVAFLVPEHQLATAYGFMQSIQNLGLAVISLAAGSILDSKGYFMLEIFFCMCISVALISALLLYIIDFGRESGLNASAKEQNAKRALEEAAEEIANASVDMQPRIKPMTAFGLRNRYYSRIGAIIPEHLVAHTNVSHHGHDE
ncbi:lysosomal dipeptide transporter MFSD1-like [Styela clava]